MFHPKHVWLNNMNFKNIVWFIKAISYFVLLRSLGIILLLLLLLLIIKTDTNLLSLKKGFPTKSYATMLKSIMANGGSWFLDWCLRCLRMIKCSRTKTCIHAFLCFAKCHEPQSSTTKLLLPMIPISIVARTFTLLWDNLCWNSCIFSEDVVGIIIKTSVCWLPLSL